MFPQDPAIPLLCMYPKDTAPLSKVILFLIPSFIKKKWVPKKAEETLKKERNTKIEKEMTDPWMSCLILTKLVSIINEHLRLQVLKKAE